ncbi:MAG TPA: hypothetical protein VEX66_01325 [Microlunatus sp.]|jgi:hypothetical protein|nr:hypothetical protein [Microlunatus sp.]
MDYLHTVVDRLTPELVADLMRPTVTPSIAFHGLDEGASGESDR